MAGRIALDLKKFKHVKSDDKSTTLQHDDGHVLTIAHGKLAPESQDQLKALSKSSKLVLKSKDDGKEQDKPKDKMTEGGIAPSYYNKGGKIPPKSDGSNSDQPRQMYAGGGGAMDFPQKDFDKEADKDQTEKEAPAIKAATESVPPIVDSNVTPPPSEVPAQLPDVPTALSPSVPAPPQALQPTPEDNPDPNSAATSGMGEAAGTDIAKEAEQPGESEEAAPRGVPQTPADHKQAVHQDLTSEDAAWQKDLANGHITPETYESLFSKKDTLGKIGTIFGLLIGGAGSGLAHQPNALLGLMDKQISNDLEAQKQSKTNAQNFLRISQQERLQKAQIGQMEKQGHLTDAQARAMNIESEAKSRMMMNRAAFHKLVDIAQKLPMGSPQRQQAENQLSMMYQSVNNENYDIADRASGASALANFGNQSNSNPEQSFQQQNRMLRMSGNDKLASDRENKHFPGITGQASNDLSPNDREELNQGITFQNQLNRFMDWTKNHSGDLNPADTREGKALAAGLQGAYRQATKGGVYKASEQDFISQIIDEDPTKFFNKIRVMPQLKAVASDSAAQIDQKAKSLGFNGYQSSSPSNENTIERVDPKSGRTVIYDATTKKPLRWK